MSRSSRVGRNPICIRARGMPRIRVNEAASRAGYRCFTSMEEFQEYVRRDVLALAPAEA